MRATVSYVRSRDEVVEIRMSAPNGDILSHINYTQLERVLMTRAHLQNVRPDNQRLVPFSFGAGGASRSREHAVKLSPEHTENDGATHAWARDRDALIAQAKETFA